MIDTEEVARMRQTALILIGIATLFIVTGYYPVALFLCIAAGALAVLAPDEPHRDARHRNQAHRR
jgi:hypothetical protein